MDKKLTIRINGDTKDLSRQLTGIKSQITKAGKQVSTLGRQAAIPFAALTAAIGGSIAAYRVQEQVEIKTRQTIKATGMAAGLTAEEIFKMAGALQEVTDYGDETIIGGQNLLLTFKNIGKDTFPRATEAMLDMSKAMGTDLKSSAIQLGKALNDPIVGLSSMARVGITFTEQQKEQIKVMQKTGDLAGAQAIILKELESQFGGVAKASAQGTGQFIQLKNIIGDLVEDIGKQFVPVLLDATKELKAFFSAIRKEEELVKTAAAVLGIAAAVTGLGVAAGIAVKAVGLLGVALSVLAAPVVIIAGAVSAAAVGTGILIGKMTEQSEATIQVAKKVELYKNKMNEAQEAVDKLQKTTQRGGDSYGSEGLEEAQTKVDEYRETMEHWGRVLVDLKGQEGELVEAVVDKNNRIVESEKTKNELLKEEQEAKLASEQEEFDAAVELLGEKEQILTDVEMIALDKRNAARTKRDIKEKATKLKLDGKHTEALRLVEETREKNNIKATEAEVTLRRKTATAVIDIANAAANLGLALGMKNSKAIFAVQKAAAIAQAVVSTNVAAVQALAVPLAPNFFLQGLTYAAGGINIAAIAATAIQGFAKGGMVTGGIPGVDSVPIMAQRNEVIVPPDTSFQDLVTAGRAFTNDDEGTPRAGQSASIEIGFKDGIGDFIEATIVERRALGNEVI